MFHLPYGGSQVQSGSDIVQKVLALGKLHGLQFCSKGVRVFMG